MPGADSVRLYFDDPELWAFEATVVRHDRLGERPSLVLDRTAFYPESGGQMADRGRLGGLAVLDVQHDAAGSVHHVLDGPLPVVGSSVSGVVDGARRREHMALHSGQHILSRALLDEVGATTVSARLGESACTLDLDLERVDEAGIARAEDLANAVVDDDLPIEAFFPSPAELAALPLRREAKVEGDVRVVKIGDFDVTPCGGTHCTRSARIGLIHVAGIERKKRRVRVLFSAGPRARRELGEQARALAPLARRFSCGPLELAPAIDKLEQQLQAARMEIGDTRKLLAERLAGSLAASEQVAVARLGALPRALLREVAAAVTERGDLALLAAEDDGGLAIIAKRPAGSAVDCRELVARACERAGGRGGGRPDHAEGRLPAGADWPALAELALSGAGVPDRAG